MPFRTTPVLGPDLGQVIEPNGFWFEGAGRGVSGAGQIASPKTGLTVLGDDGRTYMWVRSSAAIAAVAAPGTQVAITVTNGEYTVASGSGGWYAPTNAAFTGSIPSGSHFWVAKGTAA